MRSCDARVGAAAAVLKEALASSCMAFKRSAAGIEEEGAEWAIAEAAGDGNVSAGVAAGDVAGDAICVHAFLCVAQCLLWQF